MSVDPVTPEPPYANKAVVAAVGVIVVFLLQQFTDLDDEAVTAIGGAVTVLLVFVVSNFKRVFGPASLRVSRR
jgi:hypothetical protein